MNPHAALGRFSRPGFPLVNFYCNWRIAETTRSDLVRYGRVYIGGSPDNVLIVASRSGRSRVKPAEKADRVLIAPKNVRIAPK
jgi:chemotaxis response regulator CheB